jgi:hypothetical protein
MMSKHRVLGFKPGPVTERKPDILFYVIMPEGSSGDLTVRLLDVVKGRKFDSLTAPVR